MHLCVSVVMRGKEGQPSSHPPPLLPVVSALPPLRARLHAKGGIQRGRGCANCVCIPPPPLTSVICQFSFRVIAIFGSFPGLWKLRSLKLGPHYILN